MAIRTKEFRLVKIAGTANPELISRTIIMSNPPTPNETNNGNPMIIIRTVRPISRRSMVMMDLLYKM
jgi:hypothetical protein